MNKIRKQNNSSKSLGDKAPKSPLPIVSHGAAYLAAFPFTALKRIVRRLARSHLDFAQPPKSFCHVPQPRPY